MNHIFFFFLLLLLYSLRDRSGDRPLQCYRSRAADVSSWTAHPHQEKEPRGLVGGGAPGTQAQTLTCAKIILTVPKKK